MTNPVEGVRPNVPRDDELDALTVTELEDIRDTIDGLMARLDPGDTVREFAGRVKARLATLACTCHITVENARIWNPHCPKHPQP